jgi:hypothetical protein
VALVSLGGLPGIPVLADEAGIGASVTVKAMLDHITVTPASPSVSMSATTYQFTATAVYSNAPDANVTGSAIWASANSSVATIDVNTGLATILAEGSTVISAEYDGQADNTTLTVTAGTSPPPGGGGGGGGGGGSGPGSNTVLTSYMDSEGRILSDIGAVSTDGLTVLYLPEGTTALNKYGQPLRAISIKENTAPPDLPADCQFVSLTYDIGPEGATFDPPAFLIYNYSESQVPAGVAEENLVFATWQDGQWVDLEGCVVNTADNTVTVPVSHLCLFTLVAHTSPARFEVSDFTVAPVSVHPYETVTVSATVTNAGDLTGSYELVLTVDNAVIQRKTVTLKGGGRETVDFAIIAGTIGEHQVGLGNNVAKFVVKKLPAPAAFVLGGLNIDPNSVNSGDRVHITVSVNNVGDLAGTYPITLFVDNQSIETGEITLEGGGSVTYSFSFSAAVAGEHTVKIGDLYGAFEVKSPSAPVVPELPGLELTGFSTAPGYDEITNKLTSIRIKYYMNQSPASEPDSRLMVMVLFNGELLEQVPLFSVGQLTDDGKTGEFDYAPSAGWKAGEYTFKLELYDGDDILQDTVSHSLVVTPEMVTKMVSLWQLSTIIGIAITLVIVVVAIVLYCKRDKFKYRIKPIRYMDIWR